MNPILMTLLIAAGLAVFIRTMTGKIKLLAALEPADGRLDHIGRRIKELLVVAIGQKRLVGRKKERASGIMHALIFWGFCILLIRSLHLYGMGFAEGFELPLFGEESILGYLYMTLKDVTELLVLMMVVYAAVRRAVIKPGRLHSTREAYVILALIAVLMVSDILFDAARFHLVSSHGNPGGIHYFNNPSFGSEFAWTPVAAAAGFFISGIPADSATGLMTWMFWLHILTQLVFLNLLPLGKHFHVITALPNVFLKSLDYPHKKTKLLDLEDESVWEDESLGVNHIRQLDWKQGLDLYTCTECGRCKEVCPTYVTDKPLNLHDFNDSLKTELLANADKIIQRARLFPREQNHPEPEGDSGAAPEKSGELVEIESKIKSLLDSKNSLIGDVISPDTLWACTTCRACEQVCPVTIEHVPRIIAMRQGQTLMQGDYPEELNTTLRGLERNANPWGIGYDKRADWAEGLGVTTMAEDSDVEYLFWVGCAGSFDDRSKKVSKSIVKILQKAGIRFAILGVEEKCTGDFARRVGNEMLYQMMAQENVETLNGYNVKKIITACPHCLNTLKHEYPQMGGHFEVIHHTEFVAHLVRTGKIKLDSSLDQSLTYHDPCYLGRYNRVYEEPRFILNSVVASNGIVELDRHGTESFCCGAGGGRMWMEETIGKRINIERSEEIIGKSVAGAAVACPFCLTMLEDGMKELGRDEDIKIRDIAEIVADHMV
jgi:Fe-S oxidoreductase